MLTGCGVVRGDPGPDGLWLSDVHATPPEPTEIPRTTPLRAAVVDPPRTHHLPPQVYRSGAATSAARQIGNLVEDDLAKSLAGLSLLLTGHRPLQETLVHIAEFAVQAIPGAEGTGLTMLEEDRPQTVVASAEFVHAVDDVQYGIGEGPCLLAVETRDTQMSGSLGGEPRWPRFGPRVGRMGVHSVLSLPLLLPDRVVGALNVYAHAKDAFGSDAVRIGELFAQPAAVSVHNAQILAESQRLAEQLGAALTNRAVIDQALGVIMSRTGASAEEAFDRLRRMSQSQHLKVAEVSRVLMDEAVRRARARKSAPDTDASAS